MCLAEEISRQFSIGCAMLSLAIIPMKIYGEKSKLDKEIQNVQFVKDRSTRKHNVGVNSVLMGYGSPNVECNK